MLIFIFTQQSKYPTNTNLYLSVCVCAHKISIKINTKESGIEIVKLDVHCPWNNCLSMESRAAQMCCPKASIGHSHSCMEDVQQEWEGRRGNREEWFHLLMDGDCSVVTHYVQLSMPCTPIGKSEQKLCFMITVTNNHIKMCSFRAQIMVSILEGKTPTCSFKWKFHTFGLLNTFDAVTMFHRCYDTQFISIYTHYAHSIILIHINSIRW